MSMERNNHEPNAPCSTHAITVQVHANYYINVLINYSEVTTYMYYTHIHALYIHGSCNSVHITSKSRK